MNAERPRQLRPSTSSGVIATVGMCTTKKDRYWAITRQPSSTLSTTSQVSISRCHSTSAWWRESSLCNAVLRTIPQIAVHFRWAAVGTISFETYNEAEGARRLPSLRDEAQTDAHTVS